MQTTHFIIHQVQFYFVLIAANIIHDGILINYFKRSPKHSKNVYVIGFLAAAAAALFIILDRNFIYLIPAIFYAVERWLIHDPLLNLLTGKHILHIGKKADKVEDSQLDNFLEIDPPKQYVFKALFGATILVACIIIYFIIQYNF